MPVITEQISGDEQPTTIQLLTLTRSDTGQTPGFIDFRHPQYFQAVVVRIGLVLQFQGKWAYPFVDDNAAPSYSYTFRMTFSDGTGANGSGTLDAEKLVAGVYATRADMDQQIGSDQVDALARKGDGTTDDTLIAGALANADAWINSQLAMQQYATPARKA